MKQKNPGCKLKVTVAREAPLRTSPAAARLTSNFGPIVDILPSKKKAAQSEPKSLEQDSQSNPKPP